MLVKQLGLVPYQDTAAAMQAFTAERGEHTPDELWLCEHPPVFTLGLAGLPSHVLAAGDIPLVQSNRGGQVTYHGPGQIVAYPLVDLKRLGIYVKEYVYRLEAAILQTLDRVGLLGQRVNGAPGIYVNLADPQAPATSGPRLDPFEGLGKLAALGIKVSRHCSYHGLALNVAMDLEPFGRINPCGYPGLRTVDLRTLGALAAMDEVQPLLAERLAAQLQKAAA
jgi:lipoyl(octanoyl) transferase